MPLLVSFMSPRRGEAAVPPALGHCPFQLLGQLGQARAREGVSHRGTLGFSAVRMRRILGDCRVGDGKFSEFAFTLFFLFLQKKGGDSSRRYNGR